MIVYNRSSVSSSLIMRLTLSTRPYHAKTCLRAYAGSEGPDQTAHSRSLIRIFTARL